MGKRGLQINWRYAEETVNEAKRVLLQRSSDNGLIPGRINRATEKPKLLIGADLRDFYWYMGFEIPYVLWTTFRESSQLVEMDPSNTSDAESQMKKDNFGASINWIKTPTQPEESMVAKPNPEMKNF